MSVLVCFAVKEEGRFFRPPAGCAVLVTGMGPGPARRAIVRHLDQAARGGEPVRLVVTAGFAGGLDPALAGGTVLTETDDAVLSGVFARAGLRAGRIHLADRVATTRAEKAALRSRTGAEAVEMESGVIRGVCRERGVISGTVRVISDTAEEDLPVDFNALITPEGGLRMSGLLGALARRPTRVAGLLRLQGATSRASRELGAALTAVVGAWPAAAVGSASSGSA